MKNSLLALALMTLVVLGCGLDKLTSRSNTGNTSGGTNTATSSATPFSPSRPAMNDVDFARDALTKLTEGDMAAADMIDWDNFRVMTIDVGQQYRLMPNETAKNGFRSAFIPQFSSSFKQQGANIAMLTQWKEQSRSGDSTVVIASAPGGTGGMLVTVTHPGGVQKLSTIDTKQ